MYACRRIEDRVSSALAQAIASRDTDHVVRGKALQRRADQNTGLRSQRPYEGKQAVDVPSSLRRLELAGIGCERRQQNTLSQNPRFEKRSLVWWRFFAALTIFGCGPTTGQLARAPAS